MDRISGWFGCDARAQQAQGETLYGLIDESDTRRRLILSFAR